MKGISKLLRKSGKKRSDETNQSYSVFPCRRFSFPEIIKATNNFDDNLLYDHWFYGKEYKGLIDGCCTVNIERADFKKWVNLGVLRNEVVLLCQLHHPNLIRLIGYCLEDEDHAVLVYEFVANGNLEHHLTGTNHPEPLPWKQRLQICIGVARGLHYLHTAVKHTIIHRDVKPRNILLDDKWEAKLTNFGLSIKGPPSLSRSSIKVNSVAGTEGYKDPEYIMHRQLSDKSDVYSFGVVLLNVLGGRTAFRQKSQKRINQVHWAKKCIREGTINEIIDPNLMRKIAPDCFQIYMDLATSCVRDEGKYRPTMGEVEIILEKALELQESADAARKDVNPGSDQYNYPDLEYTDPGGDQYNYPDL